MLATFATLFALLFGFTGAPAVTAVPEPAAAADALWPAVDNQWSALVQCNYFLDAGADRDACTASALESFPAIGACAEEDSSGPCYWNATTRGNGVGDSFTVDAAGAVTYLKNVL